MHCHGNQVKRDAVDGDGVIGMMTEEQAWTAVLARDRAFDGRFVTGVLSTGSYCRPSCAARHPRRDCDRAGRPRPSAACAARVRERDGIWSLIFVSRADELRRRLKSSASCHSHFPPARVCGASLLLPLPLPFSSRRAGSFFRSRAVLEHSGHSNPPACYHPFAHEEQEPLT